MTRVRLSLGPVRSVFLVARPRVPRTYGGARRGRGSPIVHRLFRGPLSGCKETTPQFRRRADFSPLGRNEFRPTNLFLYSRLLLQRHALHFFDHGHVLVHGVEGRLQPPDFGGMRGGHVVLLAGIGLQVEELHGGGRDRRCAGRDARRGCIARTGRGSSRRPAHADRASDRRGRASASSRLPAARAASSGRRARWPAASRGGRRRPRAARRRRRSSSGRMSLPSSTRSSGIAAPVAFSTVANRSIITAGCGAGVARGNPPRPARDQRHAEAAFPGAALHAAQSAAAAAEPRAVVAGEEHERALVHAGRLQGIQHRAHAGIQFGHHVAVQSGAALPVVLLGGGQRLVRHGLGEVEEERPRLVALDEPTARSV